jgi:hypothetical protein
LPSSSASRPRLPVAQRQIRQQREIDARLREIVMAEDPNSATLAQKIRRQIAAESPAWNRSLLLAAGLSAVLLAAGFVYRALGPAPACMPMPPATITAKWSIANAACGFPIRPRSNRWQPANSSRPRPWQPLLPRDRVSLDAFIGCRT